MMMVPVTEAVKNMYSARTANAISFGTIHGLLRQLLYHI